MSASNCVQGKGIGIRSVECLWSGMLADLEQFSYNITSMTKGLSSRGKNNTFSKKILFPHHTSWPHFGLCCMHIHADITDGDLLKPHWSVVVVLISPSQFPPIAPTEHTLLTHKTNNKPTTTHGFSAFSLSPLKQSTSWVSHFLSWNLLFPRMWAAICSVVMQDVSSHLFHPSGGCCRA